MMRILGMKSATSHAGGRREHPHDVGPVPIFVAAIAVLLVAAPISAAAQTPPPVRGAEANSAP